MTIGPFRGEWRFLSNFWLEPQRQMLSNEHFYQSAKAQTAAERATIMLAATPGEAKRLGAEVPLRPDWEEVKEAVMLAGVRTKFYSDTLLGDRLIATGAEDLAEINHWGDEFWGVDISTSEGGNRLGKILMQVREELVHFRAGA